MRPPQTVLLWIAVILAAAAKLRRLVKRQRTDTGKMASDIADLLCDLDERCELAQTAGNELLALRGLRQSGAQTRSDTMFQALRAELDGLQTRLMDLKTAPKHSSLDFFRRRGAKLAKLKADVLALVARFETLEQQQRDGMEKAREKRARLRNFKGDAPPPEAQDRP
jgi:hypothetical protein